MAESAYDINNRLNAPVEEAYRVLRTNIQFRGSDKKVKTLVITSCNPGEGKTTVAINLAVSLANSGLKTLLVDADLRKPRISYYFDNNNSLGFSRLISGYSVLEDIVVNTSVEGLYFIPCGTKPPNPAELLGSAKFHEFMDKVKHDFDMVVIDTPPVGSVIDGALAASHADGTIIVIESKVTDYGTAQRVKEQLETVNAKIIGVVLNKISKNDYKYYYNSYSYYTTDKNKKRSFWSKLFKIKKGEEALQ